MAIYTGIMVFSMIWMVVFFMLLPVGVQMDPSPQEGLAKSAPMHTYLSQKLLITTFISICLFFLIKWIVDQGLLNALIEV